MPSPVTKELGRISFSFKNKISAYGYDVNGKTTVCVTADGNADVCRNEYLLL